MPFQLDVGAGENINDLFCIGQAKAILALIEALVEERAEFIHSGDIGDLTRRRALGCLECEEYVVNCPRKESWLAEARRELGLEDP